MSTDNDIATIEAAIRLGTRWLSLYMRRGDGPLRLAVLTREMDVFTLTDTAKAKAWLRDHVLPMCQLGPATRQHKNETGSPWHNGYTNLRYLYGLKDMRISVEMEVRITLTSDVVHCLGLELPK